MKKKVFFHTNVPGRILGFEINSKQYLHNNISINAIWDKEENPAIHIPLQDFFGYSAGKPSMNGMMIGSKSGRHYSFLPCPFDSTAEMKLQYRAGEGENLFYYHKKYTIIQKQEINKMKVNYILFGIVKSIQNKENAMIFFQLKEEDIM